MAVTHTTITLDESVAQQAEELGISVAAAARDGIAAAIRSELERIDRKAYIRKPEELDTFWAEAETWNDA